MKHPKHQNKALILKKSQITFNHFRSIREIDVENRNFKGSNQRIDLMSANFLPKVVTVKKELLQILIDDSVEVKTNQDMISKALTPQLVEGYIEAFKNSNKNSNDFKEAVKFLNTYYEDSNKKEIDL
jgi:pseudouridine-5'-phosphate glycosidase